MSGKITLVGAGPGDGGLLTLKGLQAVLSADVVVYDRLVGDEIMDIIPQNAERINAGKESSSHTIPQGDINKILVQKAYEGKNVVRLKGGDCFLFGRGGEELEYPSQIGIPFEVIPGITSALAVPAYAGIPVTHRDYSSSVHIYTGHRRSNQPLDIDFESCVKCGGTLVFLMGVASICDIAEGLTDAGMDKNMPACIIERGTTSGQKKVSAPICDIAEKSRQQGIKNPAVIVVGRVCGLGERLDWFDSLPLRGISVVVTRPKDRGLSEKLKKAGAAVVQFPCIKTAAIADSNMPDSIIQKLHKSDWAVFTSPAGVNTVFNALNDRLYDSRVFGGVKIAAIGSGTCNELAKYGLRADIVPDSYDSGSLGRLLAEKAAGQRVLLLRAKDGSHDITDILSDAGTAFEDMAVYETIYTSNDGYGIRNMISKGKADYVTFTSSSTVHAFADCVKCTDGYTGICIGKKTADTAKRYGIKTIVSDAATVDDMVDTLIREVKKCRQKQ